MGFAVITGRSSSIGADLCRSSGASGYDSDDPAERKVRRANIKDRKRLLWMCDQTAA